MEKLSIKVVGFKTHIKIGCDDAERSFPQQVELNFNIVLSSPLSCVTDNLAHTIDYRDILKIATNLAERSSWNLLEHYLHDISESLLSLALVESVALEVAKRVDPRIQSATVCLYREKK
jgi:7,8-dihydroneopterin aldolase/epimerase/oxygenase